MNLLKCTDWKVFFFRKPPKGEWVGGEVWGQSGGTSAKEAQERNLKKKKKKKLPVKKKC